MNRPALPDTPVGRHVRWWLDGIENPDGLTAADVISHNVKMWPQSPWLKSDEEGRAAHRKDWEEFGDFSIDEVVEVSPCELTALLVPVSGDRRRITFIVEADEPHRLRLENWQKVYDFDLQIRPAAPADAPVLTDIERRSEVVLGDTRVITNRGNDYFAAARLLPAGATVFLATVDGDPAGVAWGAQAPVRFMGEALTATYFFHLRIVPEHQRKGLWGALDNAVWTTYWEKHDIYFGYYMAANVAWSHVAEQVVSRPGFVGRDWIPEVYRLLLPAADFAVTTPSRSARRATAADARRIVEVLNEFHEGEEFYVPYTVESLADRLGRDPSYSWNQILIGDGAVVGLWPAGDNVEVITRGPDGDVCNRRGHVMDYAFVPGAEDEFLSLLSLWSRELAARGIDQLSIFTSKGARGQEALQSLGGRLEAYRFNTGTAAQIPDAAQQSGIYTDHLYF